VVTTALPLNNNDKAWLREELIESYNASSVTYMEDPMLIGGVKIRVGDTEIDNSIKAKLEQCFL
jgi:F0F1-type ATP synthase delta subunit